MISLEITELHIPIFHTSFSSILFYFFASEKRHCIVYNIYYIYSTHCTTNKLINYECVHNDNRVVDETQHKRSTFIAARHTNKIMERREKRTENPFETQKFQENRNNFVHYGWVSDKLRKTIAIIEWIGDVIDIAREREWVSWKRFDSWIFYGPNENACIEHMHVIEIISDTNIQTNTHTSNCYTVYVIYVKIALQHVFFSCRKW